jgi:hypothetical protein
MKVLDFIEKSNDVLQLVDGHPEVHLESRKKMPEAY